MMYEALMFLCYNAHKDCLDALQTAVQSQLHLDGCGGKVWHAMHVTLCHGADQQKLIFLLFKHPFYLDVPTLT